MLDIIFSTALGAALACFIVAKIVNYKPKQVKKELCVEEVLKAADEALAFDPLSDVKNRPQAVKPLLSVLLAIRERKAEEELIAEEHERTRPKNTALGYRAMRNSGVAEGLYYKNHVISEAERTRRNNEALDPLSGVIGSDHPHRVALARQAAERQLQQAIEQAQRDATEQAVEAAVRSATQQQSGYAGYVQAPRYGGPLG